MASKIIIGVSEDENRMGLLENGQVITTTLIGEKVLTEPVNKVVAVGTKVVTASVSRDNSSAPSGGTEFYVTATAYTPYCAGCSGTTATGINLKANPGMKLIAVDPSIIPLGSKVWVEGYGYAVAGDTGCEGDIRERIGRF